MKVAYHFDSRHHALGTAYGFNIQAVIFWELLRQPSIRVNSKVFVGDLLLHNLASDKESTETGYIKTISAEKYLALLEEWLMPTGPVWFRVHPELKEAAISSVIYVMCFEALDYESARELHARLERLDWYLGAMEVDDSSQVHWYVYSAALMPVYRVWHPGASVFWDGISEDSKDEGRRQFLEGCGFTPVIFESLNGRYTIFDSYYDYEHATRIALWKRRTGNLLGFIADDVVSRLSDVAPELGDKLYAALKAFDKAETGEELAQMVTSCRRVFEYVADRLFPPVSDSSTDHNLGSNKHKNRLLAYAARQRASDKETALVSVSIEVWASQINKLCELGNKGVHAEVLRSEARRCLLRTVLLLDDIVAFQARPFEVKGHVDSEATRELLLRWLRDETA